MNPRDFNQSSIREGEPPTSSASRTPQPNYSLLIPGAVFGLFLGPIGGHFLYAFLRGNGGGYYGEIQTWAEYLLFGTIIGVVLGMVLGWLVGQKMRK